MTAPEQQPADVHERVIVLAPMGRDAEITLSVLETAGISASVCKDISGLCQLLADGAGAAIVAEEVLTETALQTLAEKLADQPPWSDFPLIILATSGRGSFESRLALAELGSFTNATVLERPLRIATLVSAVRVALRSRLRQYELRAHLEERERIGRERDVLLHQQRRIAETLQFSLLKAPPPNAFPSLEISTQYVPAWSDALIGGDFYDVFGYEGKIALVVGDVVGKGLQAASQMAEVKFALRALVREHSDPARALERLNSYSLGFEPVDAVKGDPTLVAVLLAVVDAGSGEATIAVAGAEPPVLVRNGRAPEAVAVNGVPIGVMDNASYTAASVSMEPGDMLLLATDGITEARNGSEFFGFEGLLEAIACAPTDASMDELTAFVIDQTRTFSNGSFRDDVCLLAARHRAAPESPRFAL